VSPLLVIGQVNLPVSPVDGYVKSEQWRKSFKMIKAAVDRFQPELIVISAGFDAHANDPMKAGELVRSGSNPSFPTFQVFSEWFRASKMIRSLDSSR
jgi:hypothetical protein